MNDQSKFNQPLSGNAMPRVGGPATFMRLPTSTDTNELDACIVGVPFDIGTSNRPGARLAPREIRDESRLLRPYNMATRAMPFDSIQVADLGDVPINTYHIRKSFELITEYYTSIFANSCVPLTLGGDHSIVLPILRAAYQTYGPVAVVHVDAHADANDKMFGEKYTHGTPFRRAVEEDLLQRDKVVQIGLRGTGYDPADFDWSKEQGFKVVQAHECWYHSLETMMDEFRSIIGDHPVYLSFDIDGLDPAYAPGTGTPESGGLTTMQGLEIIRGCRGLNFIGGDLVEVSPMFDMTRGTSLLAANLVYEMLCIHPDVKYRETT
ncbi:MAG: agmatinase [Gammaproteobacteria bacterium]|nr:agmatinase [Gammaproteobacteria bacterium]MYF53639.1 agmatinase [Gammaproteobacteria bacterium]MYK43579.1 agmatinase [Gammaproteobacteria bacterium]